MTIRRFSGTLISIVVGALLLTSGPAAGFAQAAELPVAAPGQHTQNSALTAAAAKPAAPKPAAPTAESARSAADVHSGKTQTAAESANATPSQVATPCPAGTSNSAATSLAVGTQCIAGFETSTRSTLGYTWDPSAGAYTATPCILDYPRVVTQDAVYQKSDCIGQNYINAEQIAQARMVAQLNAQGVYGDSVKTGTGITANLQWETNAPGTSKPSDLLLYDRTKTTGPVGLVEMKGSWSNVDPVKQVQGYQKIWNDAGQTNVGLYHFTTPYKDVFKVLLNPCKNDPGINSYNVYTTTNDATQDGIVWVTMTLQPCPNPAKKGSGSDAPPDYQGSTGTDTTVSGTDDLLEALADDFPTIITTTVLTSIRFVPLATPLQVTLDAPTLQELADTLASASDEERNAIWDDFLSRVNAEAPTLETEIAEGDAATLGLDATEMTAAEVALDAGFITLPALFVGVALVAVVALVVWAFMHWHLFGDPHLATLDGLTYDMQTEGEFNALEVPSMNLDVQARFTPAPGSTTIAYLTALSFMVDGNFVELDPSGVAYVNGQALPASQNLTDFGDGSILVRNGSQFVVTFGADDAQLVYDGNRMGFSIDPGVPTVGLLGNNDGVPDNDLALSDGTPLTWPVSASDIDGVFADSWRITNDTSEFAYPDGNDTYSHTDLSFPSNVVTLNDFSAGDQDIARQTCNGQGVPIGPQFDDCMLDILETGDSTYATQAAAVTGYLKSPDDLTVDGSGNLTETFESGVAPNFDPDSTETINGTTVAGPVFDSSGYSFDVPALPFHASATIAFDVYVVGLTSSNAQSQTLTVKTSDPASSVVLAFTPTGASVSSGTATITPTGQGQTAQGAGYLQYRVTVPVTQYSPQLNAQLVPSGFRGILGTSLAIDNIAVGVTAVPTQAFAATLPLAVSAGTVNGVATAGAGTLSTIASSNAYTFTVPAGGEFLAVDASACPTPGSTQGLNWSLARASGPMASGGCGGTNLGLVAAGSYTLTVSALGVTGTYSLNVEAPQSFAAGLPLAVSADTVDGASAPGAGNLQSGASQQAFTFTVPDGGQQLGVDLSGCPQVGGATPTWSLINTSTQNVIQHGTCWYSDLGVVAAGSYELLIFANGVPGKYAVNLEAPVSFNAALPLTVDTDTVDGTSAPGAGDIKDGAEQDVFHFTVPAGGLNVSMSQSDCGPCFFSWRLLNSSGTAVSSGSVGGITRFGTLPADDYELVVSANGTVGTYAITLEQQPIQTFPVTLPLTVSTDTVNGASAPGAGNITDGLAEHVYSFTVPTGGQSLSMLANECGPCFFNWKLVDNTGTTVKSGSMLGLARLGTIAAGDYQFIITSNGSTGTYTLSLEQQPIQTFPVTLPLTVSTDTVNGASAPGAGNITDGLAEHVYSFTVPTGGQNLSMIANECGPCFFNWSLVNSAGTTVKSGSMLGLTRLGPTPAGDYQFLITSNGSVGTYTLSLEQQPIQTFPVTLPLTVSTDTVNGASALGAGNITDGLAEQVFSFTVPTGGQNLSMIASECGPCFFNWKLVSSTGTTVSSGSMMGLTRLGTVPAGDYQFIITSNGSTGTYTLSLEQQPIQTFPVTLPLTVSTDTINGASAPGAGNITDGLAEQVFSFTVPTGGQNLSMTVNECGPCFFNWKLVDSTGTTVSSGSMMGLTRLGTVPAGDYQFIITSNGSTGTYTLSLEQQPIQTFPVTLPLTVSTDTINGASAPGAGNITDGLAQHVYSFTVAQGGHSYSMNLSECGPCFFSWKLVNSAGTTVDSGSVMGTPSLGILPADSYQLIITSNGSTGTYTISLEQLPIQTFAVTLPLTVSTNTINGASAPGAGDITDGLAQHIYTFTVPTGGQNLSMDLTECGPCFFSWKLVNSAGTTVSSGSVSGLTRLGTIPAGDYQFVITTSGSTGTYTINLEQQPISTFPVTLPLTVSTNTINGASAPGAGNITDGLAEHIYTFTVPTGGQSLSMDLTECGPCFFSWKLVNSAGTTVSSGSMLGLTRLGTIPAGNYQFIITSTGSTGAYTINLEQQPIQTFAVTLPLAVSTNTINGASAPGAGDITDGLAEQIYTFTVPTGGQNLSMDVSECGPCFFSWKLVNSAGTTTNSGSMLGLTRLGTIPAGNYQFIITSNGSTGTYTLNLEQQPIQTFAVTLPLTVSTNTINGASAPGAGDITDGLAEQIYTFTVPSGGQSVSMSLNECGPCYFNWKLVNSAGTTTNSGSVLGTANLGTLPAGNYQFVVTSNGSVGTYTIG